MIKNQFSVCIKSFQLDHDSEYMKELNRQAFRRARIIPIFTSTRDFAAYGMTESFQPSFF